MRDARAGLKTRNWKERETTMKRLLFLAVLGLCGCETPAEISARRQIDAACESGDLQACIAVQDRIAAEAQNLALSLLAF